MIRIYCERDYLSGQEKIKYAKLLSVIIGKLKELRAVIKNETEIEVDYSITMK